MQRNTVLSKLRSRRSRIRRLKKPGGISQQRCSRLRVGEAVPLAHEPAAPGCHDNLLTGVWFLLELHKVWRPVGYSGRGSNLHRVVLLSEPKRRGVQNGNIVVQFAAVRNYAVKLSTEARMDHLGPSKG